MESAPSACPQCGAPGKVHYHTVLHGEVRVPVDPYLVCDDGHVVQLPHKSHGAESREPGDEPGLIG